MQTTLRTNLMTFEVSLKAFQTRAESALDRWLPAASLPPVRLHEAMRYATLGPGKRVRPVLVYATGTALGAALEGLDGSAAAVEIIHAYSLIHDDLPAMDDDDLRRGRPTCTAPTTKPRRSSRGMRCRRWPSRCWQPTRPAWQARSAGSK